MKYKELAAGRGVLWHTILPPIWPFYIVYAIRLVPTASDQSLFTGWCTFRIVSAIQGL